MNERMTELIYQEKYYLRGRIQMVYQMKTRSRELNRMDLKFKLEEETDKTKNITGYYEEIIQGYEDKLAVEKLKNSLLIAIAQLDDTD